MLLIMKPPFFLHFFGLNSYIKEEISKSFSERIVGISCALTASFIISLIFILLRKIKSSPTLTV